MTSWRNGMWSMPQYEMTLTRHDVQATLFHAFRRGVLWIRWWSWCLNCTLGLFMVPASAKQADQLPSGGLRSQRPHEHMVLLGHLRCLWELSLVNPFSSKAPSHGFIVDPNITRGLRCCLPRNFKSAGVAVLVADMFTFCASNSCDSSAVAVPVLAWVFKNSPNLQICRWQLVSFATCHPDLVTSLP